jgi:hypothetical protein
MDIVELEKEIIKSFKMCASKNKLNVLYQKQFAMQKKYGIEPLWDEIKKDLRLITMKIHPSWDMAKKLHFTVLHAFELCHHQDAYNYLKNKTVFMQLTPWYNTCLIAVPHLIVINTVKKCLDLITDSAHDYAYMYLAE